MQEGLTNVAKHAHATCVRVLLGVHTKLVSLRIEDDGKGFALPQTDLFTAGHAQGIGLLGINERLESLGGRLDIKSEAAKGTCLVAIVPFQEGIGTDGKKD